MSNGIEVINKEIHGKRIDFPFDNQSFGEFFFNQATKYADNICHICAETGAKETYKSVKERCVRVALKLRQLGVTSEDVVLLCTENTMDSTLPIYAAQFLRAKVASLDPSQSARDCSHLIKIIQPKIVFFSPTSTNLITESLKMAECKPLLVIFESHNKEYITFDDFLVKREDEENFKPEKVIDMNETSFIYFSSGTTGLPKGITCSHRAALFSTTSYINMDFVFDCCLHSTTFYWGSALMIASLTIAVGGSRVVCKTSDPKQIIKICSKFNVTYALLASFYAYAFNEEDFKYEVSPHLAIAFGGGKIHNNTLRRLQKWSPNIYIHALYGMTELSGAITLVYPIDKNYITHETYATSGKVVPGFSIKIVDIENGHNLGPREKGEIRVKSLSTTGGYYNQSSDDIYDDNGWLKTGDIGYYDEKYNLYIVDRIKEMFKYKSWHIVPSVLEAILEEHPAVKECVVFGINHDTDGELPTAAIVLKENYRNIKAEDIIKFVDERVDDRQKLRGGVIFVDHLPRTPSGKIVRRKARELFQTK